MKNALRLMSVVPFKNKWQIGMQKAEANLAFLNKQLDNTNKELDFFKSEYVILITSIKSKR
jgi:hypothetical protein